jgi:hypothetical protein
MMMLIMYLISEIQTARGVIMSEIPAREKPATDECLRNPRSSSDISVLLPRSAGTIVDL